MKERSEHIEFLDLIVKDLSGELSDVDKQRLNDWIESSDANRQLYESYSNTWQQMDVVEGKTSREVDMEWRRLEKAIDAENPIEQKPLKRNYYLSIAASIVIFLSVGAVVYFVWNSGLNQEVVAETKIEQVQLPEGTIVSLNIDSKLKFAKKFQSDTREVALEGEAFFEVARDTLRPFVIKTGEIYIEVLGTAFNVKAYEKNDHIEVTVESGKVAVYRADNPDDQVILVKGEKAIFKKSVGKLVALENENINYKSWKTKKIIFEDTPMEEVVRIVNEIYQSNIQLEGDNLNKCPVTTEFDNQSLETVINVLSSTLDMEITREGDEIKFSGEGC